MAPVLLQATEQWGMSAVYVDAGVDMTERFNGLRTTGGDHAVHQEIQHYLASVLVALEALHTQVGHTPEWIRLDVRTEEEPQLD